MLLSREGGSLGCGWLASANLAPRRLTHQIGGRSQGCRRIDAVPFTLRNLKEDLEDVGSNFDGAPDLEFRLATKCARA